MEYTLDDIRDAAEAKYGSTDIKLDAMTTAKLRNPLRMSKPERDKLRKIQDSIKDDDADQEAGIDDMLRVICENKTQADRLIKMCDLAMKAEIMSRYTAGTQAGEALASQS